MAASALLGYFGLSGSGVFGDLLLLETGLFALFGGLVEFSRSKGVYEIRRLALHEKAEFSTDKHRQASVAAMALFSAALVFFLFLVMLFMLK